MPTIINVHEAKTHLSRLLDRVYNGEEIILAKAGKPYALLSPLPPGRERKPGIVQGRITETFFEPLPKEELEAWEQ